MKWITVVDLERWAESIHSRDRLPALVVDLIRATAPSIEAFRFLSGEASQMQGIDGRLHASVLSRKSVE